MYFADTLTRQIQQCDYDSATAQIANIRPYVEIEWPEAWPDGSVIDSNGCLWNAQWGAGRVVQYAPDGCQMQIINVPVKNPTCPAFGGENLDKLFVATARLDMNQHELASMPHAGSLFGLDMKKVKGVAEVLFND